MILEEDIFPGIGKKVQKALNSTKKFLTYLAQNLPKTDFEGNMILTDLYNLKKANQEAETLPPKKKK